MNYKYGQEKNLSKYCVNSSYGNKDDKKTLELLDDAAYVNLGIGWSIPSINDWQELKNNCLCVYAKSYMNTNIEGIIVYKYKRNADGKRITDETSYNTYNDTHIFLPYSGLYRGREFYHEEVGYTIGGGIRGMYWSNTLNTDSGGQEAQFAIITKMSAYNYIRFNVGFVYKRFVSTELEDKGERSSGYTIRAVRH